MSAVDRPRAVGLNVDITAAARAFRGVLPASVLDQFFPHEEPRSLAALQQLLPAAAHFAAPATSHFPVGAVALGASGTVYLGANLELPSEAVGFTIHAEQSAVLNARVNGEIKIQTLVVSSWPCGLCRQFLLELNDPDGLQIVVDGQSESLTRLLPHPFGPLDLGNARRLLEADDSIDRRVEQPVERVAAAMLAAQSSYAPYTQAPSAVAIETAAGDVVAGPYIESVAFNPSIQPAVAALALARLSEIELETIRRATLVETPGARISHESVTRLTLAAFYSDVELDIAYLPS